MAPFAETARLRLRAYRDTDLPLVLALWNDPRVQRTGSSEYPRPRTDKWATEVLAPQLEGALVAVILELRTDERAEDDSDDRFVGYVLLQLEQPQSTRRDAVLAIALSPEWWGRGYGTEALRWTVDHAFRMLGLHRMSLAVMDCNEAAIALYKKMSVMLPILPSPTLY
jgi:RimJ/RimL family protein N-acetyltransferase